MIHRAQTGANLPSIPVEPRFKSRQWVIRAPAGRHGGPFFRRRSMASIRSPAQPGNAEILEVITSLFTGAGSGPFDEELSL